MDDLNTDEIRRQLAETERAHQATLPTMARALDQAFDPDNAVDHEAKAALVGVPSRRSFFRVGGLALASSAVLAACVNPKESGPLPVTGTLLPTPSTTAVENPTSPQLDAALVLTALSLENLAVQTYGAALDAKWLTGVLADAAKYFQSQHQDHAGLLTRTAKDLGQNPSQDPNAYVASKVVEPEVSAIKAMGSDADRQAATLKLAMELEDMAAQTYTKAGGLLSTPDLRQAIMSIGGIEARHYSVLAWAAKQPMVPFAVEHTSGAAPDDALIQPTGAASTPGTTKKS